MTEKRNVKQRLASRMEASLRSTQEQQMVKRKKGKVGDVIHTQTVVAASGFYWFEIPAGWREEDGIPRNVTLHGPFRSDAEVQKNQRVVLFGPQCKVTEGGQWDPAWDNPQ
jgi:hypothetical protein